MIYKIMESTRVDEFIKNTPKIRYKDETSEEARKRFKDFHNLSDKEKAEVLRRYSVGTDRGENHDKPSNYSTNAGYDRATRINNKEYPYRTNSVGHINNRLITGKTRYWEQSIFDSIKFI